MKCRRSTARFPLRTLTFLLFFFFDKKNHRRWHSLRDEGGNFFFFFFFLRTTAPPATMASFIVRPIKRRLYISADIFYTAVTKTAIPSYTAIRCILLLCGWKFTCRTPKTRIPVGRPDRTEWPPRTRERPPDRTRRNNSLTRPQSSHRASPLIIIKNSINVV